MKNNTFNNRTFDFRSSLPEGFTNISKDSAYADSRLRWDRNNSIFNHKLLGINDQQSFNALNNKRIVIGKSISRLGTQRRGRRSNKRPGRKVSVVKAQELQDQELKWLPVSLAPPNDKDDSDTKMNLITHNLVHNFVSNSLPDLKLPHDSAGTLVQIVSPLVKQPSGSKWETDSLDDLILSHTTEPIHHHKPGVWHKKPTVILVQDTPQELLPKPPDYYLHHHHESHKPHIQFQTASPEPFPRPSYHHPKPSPEPPPKPESTHHYPSPEPPHKPVYHYSYKPSTITPISNYYTTSEPHFPYTSVIIHTSTSIHPHPEPEPEPSPEPSWQSHYPFPEPEAEPEPELEDPDPEPEVIIGDETPESEPSPEPTPEHDSPLYDDYPHKPTPPPIYIIATPITAPRPPVSSLNPATISSGKPPPSIVILASPEDIPEASPPLDDSVYPAGGGGGGGPGGGGLIPIPPIIPGVLGGGGNIASSVVGVGGGGNGGSTSDCPSVQLFNVQTITNSLENKDCVINLNAPVHNVNGEGQIEAPSVQADIPLYDIPDSSTIATTTKKPSSGSMTILEHIASFFASMTIFNPISLSFWSFLFAPVSILLASGLGVAALILPWIFPSYWFGRRSGTINRRNVYVRSPNRFRDSALRFERSLNSGMTLDSFLDSIGFL
ncbi:hypothetical protein J6590_048407 [Homalodisca vitripennis]|nr:hypothetical protein J6590_048407 [Homalodisca vitripennis]